jgi:hypothetical protein
MSEGFEDEGLECHLEKKKSRTRCIALSRFSRRCRMKPHKDKDYCAIHLAKLFNYPVTDSDAESEDDNPFVRSNTERYTISRLEEIVLPAKPSIFLKDTDHMDSSEYVDLDQMCIYDYIKQMNVKPAVPTKPAAPTKSELWSEAMAKYGAGAGGGVNMDDAFQKGELEKKFFQLLQDCLKSKYDHLDMEEEYEKISKMRRAVMFGYRA